MSELSFLRWWFCVVKISSFFFGAGGDAPCLLGLEEKGKGKPNRGDRRQVPF